MSHARPSFTRIACFTAAVCLAAAVPLRAGAPAIRFVHEADIVDVQALAPNIVRVHFQPGGKATPRTLVIDPQLRPAGVDAVRTRKQNGADELYSANMTVVVDSGAGLVAVQDAEGKPILTFRPDRGSRRGNGVMVEHDANEKVYGIHGLDLPDDDAGILRTGGKVSAGVQGNAGGPFLLTRRYGLLIDSDGGSFEMRDRNIRFRDGSRPDAEYFVIVGPPLTSMAGLALLTGRPPMPPEWTLGFLNSQWGSTEQEWRELTATYESKGIPVSGYIFDFDWKAWGEDDYGEWRWNSTSGPGNTDPDKFPNGASGKFAADMLEHGIHLAGILKPRILLKTADGQPTQAAQYATGHNLWYPNEMRGNDYFTRRPAANLDFSNPETRKWFWEHLIPAFRAGMAGWWNDEADRDGQNLFNNFQFLNMARALYEGQRSVSNERAWSINRNYYLGSDRYGYAEWSGDIGTGFQSMAYQRRRMIATLNLGESSWSMDTGGFSGHPSPENYARWMEFGAFVPIFRVHGGHNEKRQPWAYGPIAESAAKRVMRLRYDLMPYLYSNARGAYETGIGVARPMFWEFPDDEQCSEETGEWMFGDALLVSPIVELGKAIHKVYLPAGFWYEYTTGERLPGGRQIARPTVADTWQDIPIYVREGSIVATQPAKAGNELSPRTPLTLDVFPSRLRAARFLVYDDDGHTYDYENGQYFRQEVVAQWTGASIDLALQPATGSYKPHFPQYAVRVHQAASAVTANGRSLRRYRSEDAFRASADPGWFSTADRFGNVTELRLAVESGPQKIVISPR